MSQGEVVRGRQWAGEFSPLLTPYCPAAYCLLSTQGVGAEGAGEGLQVFRGFHAREFGGGMGAAGGEVEVASVVGAGGVGEEGVEAGQVAGPEGGVAALLGFEALAVPVAGEHGIAREHFADVGVTG